MILIIKSFLFFFKGFRGYIARKSFIQLKSSSELSQNEVNQFCLNIEEINDRLTEILTQLNDKFPGLEFS